MEFSKLVEIIQDEPVFETGILLAGDVSQREIRRQLSRWRQAGKIYQLRRSLYSMAPPFQKINPHPFLVANRLIPASYVSLQSALAYYGMIPEHVPVTTSVTTSRPAHWETPLGIFDFRRIQVNLFYGYRLAQLGGKQQAFVASPEKALLDLVYLESGGETVDYLVELRLQNLTRLNWELLERFAITFEKPKLLRAIKVIHELAMQEAEFEDL
jgi:predicted transcriptional regulator of viral defense system